MSNKALRFERRAAERRAAELSVRFVRQQMAGAAYDEWREAFDMAAAAVQEMDRLKKEKVRHENIENHLA